MIATRHHTLVLLLVLLAGCSTPRDRRAILEREADDVNREILAERGVTFNFPEVALPDAVEFWQELSGLNFEYESAIAASDPRMNLRLRDRPFGEAVRYALAQIDARYEHWRGMIWITGATPTAVPLEPAWPEALDEDLSRQATIAFPIDCPLRVSMEFLGRTARIPIRVDPAVAERPVHFRARDMSLAAILMGIARAGGLSVRVEGGGDGATIVLGPR